MDFIDVVAGPEERTFVAYADGSEAPCPTPADSRERLGLVGILEEGPRGFKDGAPWAGEPTARDHVDVSSSSRP